MRILYLGDTWVDGTCTHRRKALNRLGHDVLAINPADAYAAFSKIPLFSSINVRTGFRLVASIIESNLISILSNEKWDLVWIDCGPELSPSFYRWLKRRNRPIVNYITDNPFQNRDFRKWDLYKKSLSLHDLTVVPREENVAEAKTNGAKNVMRVYFSYDPIAHAPNKEQVSKKKYDVIFVGSWMPERGPFAMALIHAGIDLKIIGNAWPRSPEWKSLKSCWLGPSVYGRSYVEAISSARIAIGLLSKGNRDLHTTRSVEIPYMGSAVFCAERTSEHLEMYREGKDAIFWDSPDECVSVCMDLLSLPSKCDMMANNTRKRVIDLKLSNDEVMASILNRIELL